MYLAGVKKIQLYMHAFSKYSKHILEFHLLYIQCMLKNIKSVCRLFATVLTGSLFDESKRDSQVQEA